jgi:hypothetical protein
MKRILLLLPILSAATLCAQQELMLNSYADLWHSQVTNPAFSPADKRLVVGLPSFGLSAAHTANLSLNDIFVKRAGETYLDFSQAIEKLEFSNELVLDQRFETVSIGFRWSKKWMLMAGHANRFTGNLIYNRDLPALLWNGNGPYVGQTLLIGPNVQLFDWNEWSIGLQRRFGNLTLGGKLKLLNGVSALKSDPSRSLISIYTNPDIYQLTMETDYAFYSSSIISAFDTAGVGFDVDLAKIKGKAFSSNRGTAFDLGATWELTKRLRISASVLDFGGKLNWNERAAFFESKGAYDYTGVTFPGTAIINGTDSLDFSTKIDTLNDVFRFTRTEEAFETRLPTRYYLSADFRFNDRWSLGMNLFYQEGRVIQKGLGISARWTPLGWLTVGSMYSTNTRSAANLGLLLAVKIGPARVYAMTDNLLNSVAGYDARAFNLRIGGMVAF